MIEIVFLGTSASAPSIHRGLSAQVVLYKEYRFLIDCGEGTQRQILKSGLGFKRLNRILLTHGHLDHILGLGGMISTFARWEAIDRVEIYGTDWTLERVYDLIYGVVLRGGGEPQLHIDLIEVRPGVVLEDGDFEVVAFPVAHRGPCVGYLFREKPRRPFLNDVAEALGVPRGPERRWERPSPSWERSSTTFPTQAVSGSVSIPATLLPLVMIYVPRKLTNKLYRN